MKARIKIPKRLKAITRSCSLQGRVLVVKITDPFHVHPKKGRSVVTEFSRQSRLRLLTLFNIIDPERAEPVLFITLTIPDRDKPPTTQELTRWRNEWVRRMEATHGPVPMIWRLEDQIRQSGKHEGQPWPHLHLLRFMSPFFGVGLARDEWSKILGCDGLARVNIKYLVNWRQAGYYVAKYAAKVEASPSNLVISTYLRKGRKWGIVRKKLLPLYPKETWPNISQISVAGLRQHVAHEWQGVPADADLGFRSFSCDREAVLSVLNSQRRLDTDIPF